MTILRRLLLATAVSALGLSSGLAVAATPASGWYGGVSAGQIDLNYPGGGDVDTDGYALHAGYRVNQYFAVEAGYADLGDARFQFDCPSGLVCVPELFPVVVSQTYRRADLSVLGILPLGDRFDLFAKVGYARGRYEERVRQGLSGTDSNAESSSETVYGVGGRLHFSAPWSLRLQWDRSEVSGVEVDGVWLGVEYRFGG